MSLFVQIRGDSVSVDELRADVQAAKDKGLAGQFAFTPETVQGLIELIDMLSAQCDLIGQWSAAIK